MLLQTLRAKLGTAEVRPKSFLSLQLYSPRASLVSPFESEKRALYHPQTRALYRALYSDSGTSPEKGRVAHSNAPRHTQQRFVRVQEEIAELRKKYERSRGDLKQRTVDVHMLQVRHRFSLD